VTRLGPRRYGCGSAYFLSLAFVVILITLYRVQCELEDPFDGNGDDDVRWEQWRAQLDQLRSYGSDGPALRDAMLATHLSKGELAPVAKAAGARGFR